MQRKIKSVIVVGAGPSGLFAARSLAKQGVTVTVLEKTAEIGGKCSTYTDRDDPSIKSERGAVLVAPNYGVVLDAIQEKQVEFEEPLATEPESVNLLRKISTMSLSEKISFGVTFAGELCRFTYHTACYQSVRDHLQELPPDYQLPFSQFAEKYQIENINLLLKSFVTAFGYGLMEDCPAHAVMEYIGVASIPAVLGSGFCSGLVNIKHGYQTLMQRIAEDFTVITSVAIHKIERNHEVSVSYSVGDRHCELRADALVLAISPQHWRSLGMELTPLENQCADAVTYFRYPVAICKLQGYSPRQKYVPNALEAGGLQHAALFTTRDNRHRQSCLGTVYINLPPKDNSFAFTDADTDQIKQDLQNDFGAQSVEILEKKIWEDYMPSLPWSLRLALENGQMQPNVGTLYVGAYALGGFEDVACVAAQSTKAVEKYILKQQYSSLTRFSQEFQRLTFFYSAPRLPAVNEVSAVCKIAK